MVVVVVVMLMVMVGLSPPLFRWYQATLGYKRQRYRVREKPLRITCLHAIIRPRSSMPVTDHAAGPVNRTSKP
ncbi:hypothetical protein M0802_010372 [Mischocyttarus mexicanus]|nr:hypothetical protein M0802_010372 [Mischocyttarus mexicanus]